MKKYLGYGIDALVSTAISAVAFVGGAFIMVGVFGIHNDVMVYLTMVGLATVMFAVKGMIEKRMANKMKRKGTTNE